MSDTGINDYYPEETPKSLVAGEAADSQPATPDAPVQETVHSEVEDLGIDLPDIPLPDDDPIEDGVADEFSDAAFNFAVS